MIGEGSGPLPFDHDAVFYGTDDAALVKGVVAFLAAGLRENGAAIVIASAAHERTMAAELQALGFDRADAGVADRLFFWNADALLGTLLARGRLVRSRFRQLVGARVRALSLRYRVRAYGEMVGLLHAQKEVAAAEALEQLWNELLRDVDFSLLCGYPIDVFGAAFEERNVAPIVKAHRCARSTVAGLSASLDYGIGRAMNDTAAAVRAAIKAAARPEWSGLSDAEATILWLHENLPAYADEIVSYAREYFGTQAV